MAGTTIEKTLLRCPECGQVCNVSQAIHDGTKSGNGKVFDSDGSLGCPRCFYVNNKTTYMKDFWRPEVKICLKTT